MPTTIDIAGFKYCLVVIINFAEITFHFVNSYFGNMENGLWYERGWVCVKFILGIAWSDQPYKHV